MESESPHKTFNLHLKNPILETGEKGQQKKTPGLQKSYARNGIDVLWFLLVSTVLTPVIASTFMEVELLFH